MYTFSGALIFPVLICNLLGTGECSLKLRVVHYFCKSSYLCPYMYLQESGLRDGEHSVVDLCFELLSKAISTKICASLTVSSDENTDDSSAAAIISSRDVCAVIFGSQVMKQAFLDNRCVSEDNEPKPVKRIRKVKSKEENTPTPSIIFSQNIGCLLCQALEQHLEFRSTELNSYFTEKLLTYLEELVGGYLTDLNNGLGRCKVCEVWCGVVCMAGSVGGWMCMWVYVCA